jgi:hypothetical protein
MQDVGLYGSPDNWLVVVKDHHVDSSKTTKPLQRIYRLRTLQHSQFCSAKEEQHMYSSKTTETLQRIYRLRTLQHFSILLCKRRSAHGQQQDHRRPCGGSKGLGLFSISQFCSAKEEQHMYSSKTTEPL